jgi:hypothetical protein
MQTFETDLADALSLITVAGLMQLSRAWFDLNPKVLDYEFDGLLPAQHTEAQRHGTGDTVWPAQSVRHIVARVGATTLREYLERVDASLRDQLGRHVFTLWMSAFDAFLERHGGGSSTLGTKLGWL